VTRTHTRRGGFTLIELMVVVLLIITLAALSAGAFYKIQAAQRTGATEATVRKVQILLDGRWKSVLDDARRSVPDQVLAMAGGDKERATSLWTYAKLKNEFPERFNEVWTQPPTPGTPVSINLGGAVLTPRSVFTAIASKQYNPPPTDQEQAAALLYAALTATGSGGTGGEMDGLNQQVGTTPSGLTVFVDNWGTPITFVRWASPPEVQSEPFSRPNVVQTRAGPFQTQNPLDPTGKLLSSPKPHPLNSWGVAGNPNRAAALLALGLTDFSTANVVPTLISAGADKEWGLKVYGEDSADAGSDNIVGYRLRREGAQGN
jgi:type II secretory pathway pseudopilin PulG